MRANAGAAVNDITTINAEKPIFARRLIFMLQTSTAGQHASIRSVKPERTIVIVNALGPVLMSSSI